MTFAFQALLALRASFVLSDNICATRVIKPFRASLIVADSLGFA